MRTHEQARRSRRGFTLTDLIVAMTLITIIASLAVPAFFNRSEVSLENAAQLLARELRIAQNEAAYLDREVRVGFYPDGDGYWIDTTLLVGGADTHKRRYSQNAVFEGIQITQVDLGDGQHLVFGPRGTAETGARIRLEYDGDARVVTVEDETGMLDILGSTGGFVDDGF